jgi:hypothetical protein
MKTTINLNFQEGNGTDRPDDASLNRETLMIDSIGNIPEVGDFVCFDNEKDIETPYKVKTRLFEYKYNEVTSNWTVAATVVVERQEKTLYANLKKM